MANVQTQFKKFNDTIRLDRFRHNQILREKRDIIRTRLDEELPKVFEDHGEVEPKHFYRDQGSYEIGTGIVPVEGDYDIDQGLYFEASTDEWTNPVVLKERVFEALEDHTEDVSIRRSCVTVYYQREGEKIYHVDIAVYSAGVNNQDGVTRLAKGKRNSDEDNREWQAADPEGLINAIYDKYKDSARHQFRRIARYFKRWKGLNFPSEGSASPPGIALTIATYDNFQATYSDPFAGIPDDLNAMRKVVSAMLDAFKDEYDDEQNAVRRLRVYLPVAPTDVDLFERLSNKQMKKFEAKLKRLLEALDYAAKAVDTVDACEELQKVFGEDFPVPAKEETAKYLPPAVITSGNSA